MHRRIPAIILACILLSAGTARAAEPSAGGSSGTGTTSGNKDWARQDGPRLNIGIDLDISGPVPTIASDAGVHEVNAGVMALIAYESSRVFAVTLRGGILGSVTYGGGSSGRTSDGFLAPVLIGARLQLPLSTFRIHIEGAIGYAYGNRFDRWVRSGSGASRHQMVVDLRLGTAIFFNAYLSLDVALFYRLPNVLVRVLDSKDSKYAHTFGATVGVGVHF